MFTNDLILLVYLVIVHTCYFLFNYRHTITSLSTALKANNNCLPKFGMQRLINFVLLFAI